MAVTNTTVSAGANAFTFDCEATADGDVGTGNVAHGLGAVPLEVTVTPLLAAAITSGWFVATLDANNVALTKGVGAGSGAAGNQIRVTVKRPHSIGR